MTTPVFVTPTPSMPCNFDVTITCDATTWATYSAAVQTAAMEYGAFTMWSATGRRYGLCSRTIRPCGRTCTTNEGIGGYFWSEGSWYPYMFNGAWRNCWCGTSSTPGCCTCEPSCQIRLPGPVYSIPATGVSQDGGIVPVDAWRVDDGKWLVRTDGTCWPECQDYDVDSGLNTLFVTYWQGVPVPSVVASAAGMLASEFAKACVGQPCALPQRVTSVARQGVTMSNVSIDDLLKKGLTGMPIVDSIIARLNPGGLPHRLRISSLDDPKNRIVTQP